MAGLLEKDIRLLWGTKQTLVILFAIAVAVAFSGNGNFIIGYLPFVVEMIAISTIAYDEMDQMCIRDSSYPACTDCGSCDEMVYRGAWIWRRRRILGYCWSAS